MLFRKRKRLYCSLGRGRGFIVVYEEEEAIL
jgi:hypothetical protein